SESVIGFTNADVSLGGTAGAGTVMVTGGPDVYNMAVSGMTGNGTVIVSIGAGVCMDVLDNANTASINTSNEVIYDNQSPDVEITLAGGQSDPASISPINFMATFNENVIDFTPSDVTIGGAAGASMAVVTGGPDIYNIAISGMTSNGTVSVTIDAGVCTDVVGNENTISLNTINSITYTGVTGVGDISNRFGAKVYYSYGNLVISFNEIPQEKVLIEVYNVQGQHILKKNLMNKLNHIPVSPSSYYFIRLSDNDYIHSVKIFAR
ncbi:MAG: T9SS type A sorting domain-containing protein, partial [Bacteroidota bacterium]